MVESLRSTYNKIGFTSLIAPEFLFNINMAKQNKQQVTFKTHKHFLYIICITFPKPLRSKTL